MSEISSSNSELRNALTARIDEDDEPIASTAPAEALEGSDSQASVEGRDPPDTVDGPQSRDEGVSEDDEPEEQPPVVQEQVNQTVVKRSRKKKGRKKVAAQKKSPQKTLDEIPRDKLLDLEAKGHSTVKLEIKRQNPTGTWSQIRTVDDVPIYGLFDLQGPVRDFAGGGKFIYTVTSMQTREQLAPRWAEIYDGRPRETPNDKTLVWDDRLGNLRIVAKGNSFGGVVETPFSQPQGPQPMMSGNGQPPMQQQLAGQPPQQHQGPIHTHPLYAQALQSGPQPQRDPRTGQLAPPPPGLLPPWLQQYAPDVQWTHVLEQRIKELEAQQHSGGGMANQWVHHEIRRSGDVQAELASVRAQLNATQQQTNDKLETLKREYDQALEREKEARINTEKQLERERSDAKYEALLARIENSEKNKGSGVDWPALLSAVAPLGTAVFKSMSESKKVEKSASTEMMKTMLSETNKEKPSLLSSPEALASLIAAAAPLITKVMDSNGPAQQAELMNLQHEQQMMHMKMIVDTISASMPEETPMKQVIDQAIEAFGQLMIARQQQQRQQLPRQPQGLPAGSQPQQPSQGANPGLMELIQRMKESDAEAGADVEMIYSRLPDNLGFHTIEWCSIMFNVHVRQNPAEIAEVIVDRLVECHRYNMMPAPLQEVFTRPEESLQTVFNPLPVAAKHPEYVDALVRSVVEELVERGIVVVGPGEGDEAPPESPSEPEPETPSPRPYSGDTSKDTPGRRTTYVPDEGDRPIDVPATGP